MTDLSLNALTVLRYMQYFQQHGADGLSVAELAEKVNGMTDEERHEALYGRADSELEAARRERDDWRETAGIEAEAQSQELRNAMEFRQALADLLHAHGCECAVCACASRLISEDES